MNYTDPSGHWFFSVGIELTASFIVTYKNTTQITIDTKGYFSVENSRSYGVKLAWPKYSVAGFFMGGTGYISNKKKRRQFDIGADVEIGGFSISAGLSITTGSATTYASLGYTPKRFSKARGYLKIIKPKEISPHAYVVTSNSIGRYSIKQFIKKRKNYKLTKYIKGKKIVLINKKEYIKASFCSKNFGIYKNKIAILKK